MNYELVAFEAVASKAGTRSSTTLFNHFNLIGSVQFYLYSTKSQQQSPKSALHCKVNTLQ